MNEPADAGRARPLVVLHAADALSRELTHAALEDLGAGPWLLADGNEIGGALAQAGAADLLLVAVASAHHAEDEIALARRMAETGRLAAMILLTSWPPPKAPLPVPGAVLTIPYSDEELAEHIRRWSHEVATEA